MLADLPFNALTHDIISAAIEVHRELGPGLLESAYLPCLQLEIGARKLRLVTQRVVPITYKGTLIEASYRLDLLVEDTVVVSPFLRVIPFPPPPPFLPDGAARAHLM